MTEAHVYPVFVRDHDYQGFTGEWLVVRDGQAERFASLDEAESNSLIGETLIYHAVWADMIDHGSYPPYNSEKAGA